MFGAMMRPGCYAGIRVGGVGRRRWVRVRWTWAVGDAGERVVVDGELVVEVCGRVMERWR